MKWPSGSGATAHSPLVQGGIPFSTNQVLDTLTLGDLCRLKPYLGAERLSRGEILGESSNQAERIYFPETCVVALVVAMSAGNKATVGLIGREGAVCGSVACRVVLVSGSARFLSLSAKQAALEAAPGLEQLLLHYADALHGQVMQVAACNALHPVEARLARFLLSVADRLGPRVPLSLTQDDIAHALGVQRCTVNASAKALQRAGLISYRRGTMVIQKRAALEAVACECYGVVCSCHA
jgi:CRP-like cAMP-binding protein